ncbi:BTAD domain-containing putative transcriptional regulator [Streptomyces sp. NPDC059837]|jgi:DNA-binding SARP family transcriptional activator|uniref:AfsR/SARP family transcriptional regulator n=1 Tax=unclassified Streptomyces TaxID=2593676 RepID=UPI00225360EA|nr:MULTISPECIES: AfsR/SARP family transcriptional regulator [unclassified Streptomyces]MCX4402686.1 AfsR/SARP family transcriptional regulator [Streptomyces sp. NBC_01764]MCX5182342.1 AfsR/SARP family transcriptional regulator [Streptomyces sp. NBC_00268]
MQFRLIGPPGVDDGIRRTMAPKGMTTTLFVALLLRANQAVDSASLVTLLWPGTRPPSADANLRQYASRLRTYLQESASQDASRLRSARGGGYLLELDRDELDLTVFDDLTTLGREALESGDVHTAQSHLQAAVDLWKGPMCQGTVLAPELEVDVLYWDELRLSAQLMLLQTRLRLGEYHLAIAEIRPILASNPLCEELWGMLMLAFYRSHRRGEALEVFRTAHRRFVRDLGIEPTPDLKRLHQAILAGDCPLDGFSWLTPPVRENQCAKASHGLGSRF